MGKDIAHAGRAHSKFSASGAERWFNCPASVKLSEGMPDKSSPWAEEGTRAHEMLETAMQASIDSRADMTTGPGGSGREYREMVRHVIHAANFILGLHAKTHQSEITVETRVYLDRIHPAMFGTYDGAVIEHFGTLHVFDFKYGAGHFVAPKNNLQMIFYGIGLAEKFDWNFKRVRLWIIQPRVKGYDGPLFWDIPILELKSYVPKFREAVERVEKNPDLAREGQWCHWCKAKSVCPLKRENKLAKAREIFSPLIEDKTDENEKAEKEEPVKTEAAEITHQKSEADWRKEKIAKARNARKAKTQRKIKTRGRTRSPLAENFF